MTTRSGGPIKPRGTVPAVPFKPRQKRQEEIMKASELIQQLAELKAKHGDCLVSLDAGNEPELINEVYPMPNWSQDSRFGQDEMEFRIF